MVKTNAPEKGDAAAVASANTLENSAPTKSNQGEVPMRAYVRLWSYASPIDVLLRCLGALACAGGGTAEPLMAIVFGDLVNLLNGGQTRSPEEFRSRINRNALYFVYLFIGKFACLYVGAVLFSFTASRMTSKIRLRYLSTVLHQPISYFDTNAPGTIAASLANDTNVVQVGLAEKVGIVCQVCSMMLCAFIISFIKSWKLTLVTATMVVYIVLATGFFGGWNATVEAKINESLNQASGVAEEALSSVLNVTALGASDKMVGRFTVYVKAAMRSLKHIGPLQACIYGNMFLAIYCAYALALFYGVKLVNKGEIADGGAIFTVLFCMIIASGSLGYLAPLIPDFTKAGAAAQQILRMIGDPRKESSTKSRTSSKTVEPLRGDLELKHVTFSYPERPGVTVLEDMSLHIPANKVTALVGHSGSGKSTIVGLLERFYTVNSGAILVDGENIQDLDLTWWRSKIGLVQQEPVLFNDTIYENVLNGLHGVEGSNLTEEQKRELVVEACKQANAHGFIQKLPKGYHTSAGERAGLLSGGQRQRIAIARSIVSKPNILLLDEATSALDSESERAVSLALDKVSQGRTTVMIAHKLSTVENADNIVVMSNGAIVEQGTHTELVAKDGHYCRLLQAQAALKHTPENKNPAEVHEESNAISRKLTRQSTQGQVLDELPSPLESETISRRHSLLYCMYKIYCQNPSLVFPSLLGLVAALVCGAVYPLQAVFFSRLVTVFQAQGSEMIDKGNFWALMFFILGLSQLLGFLALFYFLAIVGSRVGHVYRLSYFASMLNQDIGFFQSAGNTSGGLTALLAADGVDISMFFGGSAGLIAVFIVDIIACCILALAVYWKLALVAIFGCLPAIMTAGFLRMRIDLTAQDRCAAAFLENARYSTEAVAAIRTVCSLTMESKVEDMYQQKLRTASVSSVKDMLLAMLLYALSDSLTLAACALTFWYGGRLISFQELSTGQFFIIFAAIIFGGQSAGIMFGFTGSTGKAHAAMNRILYLNQSRPPINSSTGLDPSSSTASDPDTPAIEFRDVQFRYPSRPSVPVLSGVSFSVFRGSHICIVGPSGCGKSTVIALLERFYDLQGSRHTSEKPSDSGAILVYGRPISEWDISKLRKTMGLVAQDTTLYQGTIQDNVLMGIEESASSKEELKSLIEGACKQANIHDFITSLPQSYNTSVGARGVALSGGQRQRLALARCLVRNPDILLLDEATSALDSESEKTVREALRKARRERDGLTIVSVSHNVEGMKDADQIFVMDEGAIAEEGGWDELMIRKGRLWRMVVQGVLEGTS